MNKGRGNFFDFLNVIFRNDYLHIAFCYGILYKYYNMDKYIYIINNNLICYKGGVFGMKKILPIVFLFIIAFVFVTAVKSGADTVIKSKKNSSVSSWNAEKAFPFENESEKPDKETKNESLINKVNNTVIKGEDYLENMVTGKFPYQMKAVLLKNYFQKYLRI